MTRVGVVPYLNAAPLVAALPAEWSVTAAVPGALADALRAGAVDAALLPVAAAFAGTGDGWLGRHGIGSDGEVESVLAFLPAGPRRPPRRVVLDAASRTSATLLRALLAREDATPPTFVTSSDPDPVRECEDGSWTLVIGDAAMRRRREWGGGVLDLGGAWTAWTGLPFVFARWTARAGLSAAERAALARDLDAAASTGLARVPDLARERGPAHGLSEAEARRYLTRSIRYVVDERAEAGLARFRAEWRRLEGAVA